MATTSGARTSTRIGAGPDRAPCVAHAGSHVTASRMRLSEDEVSEKVSDDDETRSSRTVGDRSVARPPGTVSLTGTVPRHLAKAKGTRRGDPVSPSPIAASSRGSRRSRSGDVGSTPRTGSLTPALTIPRAATAPSEASMTSYSQSHGNAVCMDSGGCATSRHARSSLPPPSASPAVTPASGSATTTTNRVRSGPRPSSSPAASFGSAPQGASHGPCALKPHSLFFRPREPARMGHRFDRARAHRVPHVDDDEDDDDDDEPSVGAGDRRRRRSRPIVSSPPHRCPPQPTGRGVERLESSAPEPPAAAGSIEPRHPRRR